MLPLPDYAGVQPLPASDGKPMLWPLSIQVRVDAYSTEPLTLYGFLDVNGKLVLPQRFSSYTYCPDGTGRASYLIAQPAGAPAEVYALTGKLLRRTPTSEADCGGGGHVVFRHEIEPELNKHNDGLLDLATGRTTLPMVKERHIQAVDDSTVNVSDPSGEFFLDLATGRRTPHVGWLSRGASRLEQGAPGLPATSRDGKGLTGFVSRSGNWVLKPRYLDSNGFSNGIAWVQLDEKRYTFLDASLHEVGGTWDEIEEISSDGLTGWTTTGYHVSGSAGQSLLDPSLKPIVPVGKAEIACDWSTESACSVTEPDGGGPTRLVVPPAPTTTPLAAPFTKVLSGAFAGQGVEDGITAVLALATGASVDLGGPANCTGAGTALLVCKPAAETLAPIVLDNQGRRTAFASAAPIPDPVPGAPVNYFQVTGGAYQGIVDADRTWRYRTSLYIRLED